MGGGGQSSSSSDSKFERRGTSSTQTSFSVPADLLNTISATRTNVALPGTDDHASLITSLMTRDLDAMPGKTQLEVYLNLDAVDYEWYESLLETANISPYSSTFEADTRDAYIARVKDLIAGLDSANLRTGFNHAGLAKGELLSRVTREREEVLDVQKTRAAAAQVAAANTLLALEQFVSQRKMGVSGLLHQGRGANVGQALQAGEQRSTRAAATAGLLQLEGSMRSGETRTTTDDLVGFGSQTNDQSSWDAGFRCCFIFMESLNGKLPWYVRVGREEFGTEGRIEGYRRMSAWLVPLMRRSRVIKSIVNVLMIQPFLLWGAVRYKDPTARPAGKFMEPVCRAWFWVWKKLGGSDAK